MHPGNVSLRYITCDLQTMLHSFFFHMKKLWRQQLHQHSCDSFIKQWASGKWLEKRLYSQGEGAETVQEARLRKCAVEERMMSYDPTSIASFRTTSTQKLLIPCNGSKLSVIYNNRVFLPETRCSMYPRLAKYETLSLSLILRILRRGFETGFHLSQHQINKPKIWKEG